MLTSFSRFYWNKIRYIKCNGWNIRYFGFRDLAKAWQRAIVYH